MDNLIKRRMYASKWHKQLLIPSTNDNGGGTFAYFYNGDSSVVTKSYAYANIQRSNWLAKKNGEMSAVFYNETENAISIGTMYGGAIYPTKTENKIGGTIHEHGKITISNSKSYSSVGSVPAGGSLKVSGIEYVANTFPCVWLPANLICELYGDIDEWELPDSTDYVFTQSSTSNKRITFYTDGGQTVSHNSGYYQNVFLSPTFSNDTDVIIRLVNSGAYNRDKVSGIGLFLPNDIQNAYYCVRTPNGFMGTSYAEFQYKALSGYRIGVACGTEIEPLLLNA